MSGVLVLAATPLGNPSDASPRLGSELATADVVAAEDTRRLGLLRKALGVAISGRVVSYFEGNESARIPELLRALGEGSRVLLVTDAGMPSVSDPGYRLVVAALDAGYAVTCVPGPSAVTTALAVSGLPVDRFCFEGFLPRKAGERRRRLAELAAEPRTLVFFEAPHRVPQTLADLAEALGAERPAALCRELTKTYEEVRRGPLAQLARDAEEGVRGEVTLVVGGCGGPARVAESDLVAEVRRLVAAGADRRTAVSEVAARHGVPRRVVYNAEAAAPPAP